MDESKIEDIDETIALVCRQTNYSKEIAESKLKEFNYDSMKVIREYLGVDVKPKNNEKVIDKSQINQEMYKQFRSKLEIKSSNQFANT
jgi:hypothetical protein